MAVEDKRFGARQLETIARAFGFQGGRFGAVLRAFVDRERNDGVARRDFGQPFLGQPTAGFQSFDSGDGGGQER